MENLGKISRCKLLAAGYVLLRDSDIWQPKEEKTVPCIKYSNKDGVWCLHSKYETKKERDRVMSQMIDDPNHKYITEAI